ncbi:MAG: acireductone synthase [Candidatus Methylomirabilaceae bacterium]
MHGPHGHSAPDRVELTDARAVLLDIEGTTTPIEFVHEVLFPYARARVREFFEQHAADPGVRADIAALKAEHAAEREPDAPPWEGSGVAYVNWLMDRDRKSTGLKSLQGKIWETGYRAGELRGRAQVYPDVAPALARWREQGKDIAIFSSGSIQAQRSLFANTTSGDLTRFIRAYFDTTTGPKREPESYRRIAAALERTPGEILFISDVGAELDAAQESGMRTALCARSSPPGTAPGGNPVIRSFDEL